MRTKNRNFLPQGKSQMLKKTFLLCLTTFALTFFCLNAPAQTRRTPSSPNKSVLTEIELPAGAVKIAESDRPADVKTKLNALITLLNKELPAGSKTKFQQGDSEVVSWTGIGVNSTKAAPLMKKIEGNFQAAKWKYELLKNKDADPTAFSLKRTQPKSRQLIGFFMTETDALLLVVAELAAVEAGGVDVTGKWNMIGEAMGQSIPVTLELEQSGETVNGTFSSHLGNGTIQDIKVTGNTLDALAKVEVQGQIVELKLKGNVDGDKMKGTLNGKGLPPINFTATRAK